MISDLLVEEMCVQVKIYGVPEDDKCERTHVITNNGFHPVWNKTLTFNVSCPDLALVMFRVVDDEPGRDVMVAQYCLPFNCIQTGYRMVALRDVKGEIIGDTSLFVHISIGPILESTNL